VRKSAFALPELCYVVDVQLHVFFLDNGVLEVRPVKVLGNIIAKLLNLFVTHMPPPGLSTHLAFVLACKRGCLCDPLVFVADT
jgi:hypothetical protein